MLAHQCIYRKKRFPICRVASADFLTSFPLLRRDSPRQVIYFLARAKKVGKEALAAPACGLPSRRKGSPGRWLNSLRSDNATGLLPANLPPLGGAEGKGKP